MRLLLLLAASLVGLACAKPVKDDGPEKILDLRLEALEGSLLRGTLVNKGKKDIRLFTRSTILDPNPVRKVSILSPKDQPRFIGVRARVSHDNVSDESLILIKRNKPFNFIFDVAHTYDLSKGGAFDIIAEGIIPYAEKKSNDLTGQAAYRSNRLTVHVNGTTAHLAKRALEERATVERDCVGDRALIADTARQACAMVAIAAAQSALTGDANQFVRYFRTADPGIRGTVAARFFAVANECAGNSQHARIFCSDPARLCQSDYISVTLGNSITNCDLYWQFPTVSNTCHGVGQATTTIHEITHVDGVFNPPTDDYQGHYGWPALADLSPEQAIMNADNYGFYANSIYINVGC
ncbi:hypothetical protein EJ06DRAFT_384120 [Trichodelitschia bisporula]|uniref:Neutral protease 2 n=1 Tax=Trichodelitschia bisporula TaxID=703511 RepID=A0A6G1HZK9_9PEZI|nr:hypothetical protein EJ06DRAFT_384120 [Trichodelitschia bisporula]